MTTIKEQAQNYEQKTTKNVAELPELSVEFDLKDGEGKDKNGNVFKYQYIDVNGEEYRIPGVVLGQIKDILEAKPDLKTFKVKRTGEGKTGTRYTVIPLS